MPSLPAHSPLGASGAARWMKCPGSVQLSAGCADEESEFAKEGTIAHSLAALCLEERSDAWTHVGSKLSLFEGYDITFEMADAVQVYLDAVRGWHEDMNQGNTFIERRFHCPSIHELYFGTSDLTHILLDERELHVWDYKHGAGIVVDVQNNVQEMYYGAGMLTDLDLWNEIDTVVLHIAQPRGFHYAGPIRTWEISTDDLDAWLNDTLVPAMDVAMVSRDTASGTHCMFCPARAYNCPQIADDMNELEKMMTQIDKEGGAEKLSNEEVGRYLELFRVAKVAAKAAEKTAYARLKSGSTVPGMKLVTGRTNRVWKKGAEAALKKKFKDAAYEKTLVSPTKAEKMIGGAAFAERWAFKPKGDITTAPDSDSRRAINVDTKSLFKPTTKKG
jgi:hypothetical protein